MPYEAWSDAYLLQKGLAKSCIISFIKRRLFDSYFREKREEKKNRRLWQRQNVVAYSRFPQHCRFCTFNAKSHWGIFPFTKRSAVKNCSLPRSLERFILSFAHYFLHQIFIIFLSFPFYAALTNEPHIRRARIIFEIPWHAIFNRVRYFLFLREWGPLSAPFTFTVHVSKALSCSIL